MPSSNPILNNPYEEPAAHYATNSAGELDYERVMPDRRGFTPDIQSVPVRTGAQRDLLEAHDASAAYGDFLVNLLRREVKQWRLSIYPGTTRVTRELLHYWFLDPERENRLFFAQREAIETAVWLNEVAGKSNPGQHILSRLAGAQRVNGDAAANLPRIAFKMATGAGKTVVMAALIAYHFCNRQEYRNDARFADNFLAVAPGITIRDRLSVLCVQRETGAGGAGDYYSERLLVPHSMRKDFGSLNAHIAIANFQAFQPRALQGNKRSPFDGKIGADGEKTEAVEDYSQVIKRLLPGFRAGSRLLVLNDEAHHCYLPKQGDPRKAEGENAEQENARAAVWFRGLVELARRFKIRAVYDLSATPYYLTGSGYEPYSLFPWVVTDFGLTEAIESGLVKIPFLPTSDDTDRLKEPVLRNLYEHVRDGLPKSGRRTRRIRATEEGTRFKEAPPHLPEILQAALNQFYRHYDEDYHRRGQLTFEAPPVFIVVCNNTSVSREIFKFIAGYEQPGESPDAPPLVQTGRYDLFSNYDPQTLRPHRRPPTLLIDSDALENSGQIDDSFKRVFAPEIEQFKTDYRVIHGAAAAENITDAGILREIVNTVGKRGTLGAHIRCVVSVSMLTEGWDANTVTHVVGIRAFGSQLLCEQVAGRALRRKSYVLAPYDPDSGERLTDQIAVSRQAVNNATKACRRRGDADWLVILGFSFESDIESKSVTTSHGQFQVTKVRMHDDLLQEGLLKKDKKAASFVTIGEPDIALKVAAASGRSSKTQRQDAAATSTATVEIKGLDIYDPIKDEVKSRDVHDIAYWMVDTDYDGANFIVRQAFFCGGDKDEFDAWKKGLTNLALLGAKKKAEKTLKIEIDEEAFARVYGHISHRFEIRDGQQIAVRVISQFGEETTKVLTVK